MIKKLFLGFLILLDNLRAIAKTNLFYRFIFFYILVNNQAISTKFVNDQFADNLFQKMREKNHSSVISCFENFFEIPYLTFKICTII